MDRREVKLLLETVANGGLTPDEALAQLRDLPVKELGFAKVDTHRAIRHGVPETVYCPGKTPDQVVGILQQLIETHSNVLATRADAGHIDALRNSNLPNIVYPEARIIVANPLPNPGQGFIAVVTAGTSDIPVAEEAVVVAEVLGNRVERFYDCGVAGIHRLIPHLGRLNESNVIVVVAGMEGALPSVLGGLVDKPVIGVPTSIGYGASLGGLSALLSMINSCAPGVSVVNIDNGYGAAVQASQINHLASRIK